jgi:hypothetical protein
LACRTEGRLHEFTASLVISSFHVRKKAPPEEPMFQCVGMLAAAVGPNLTKLLHDQLDLMFACGLSAPLHHALIEIAKNIPPLLKTIQGKSACFLVFGDLISSTRSPLGHVVDDPQRQTVQAPWCTTSPHAGQCFHYFPGPQLISGRAHLSEAESLAHQTTRALARRKVLS